MLTGLLALIISNLALAQLEHGAGITKACGPPVRTCDVDLDCADGNECTDNTCDTQIGDTKNCTFTVFNLDGFNDSLTITDISDFIQANPPVTITAAQIDIIAINGNATCAAGPSLPCV
ncbi:MAG: hypothetical protein HKO99_09530, partial [Xanthomonadales bacterium]|nr:hypothetical protein [Xanthomonadales bacterium]